MGEAILTRAPREINKEDLATPVPGWCMIFAHVYDSDGNLVPNCAINCNDGGTWYNYHTNENGTALFMTNSGAVDITAYNFSASTNEGYNIIDQYPSNTVHYDAPLSTKMSIDAYLINATTRSITATSNMANIRFQVARLVNVQMVGGGAGGQNPYVINDNWSRTYSDCDVSWTDYGIGGYGGGGGAYNVGNNIVVNNTAKFNIVIGAGGAIGGSGGTTSAFGYSANGGYKNNGGGSGTFKGGNGGYVGWTQNTSNSLKPVTFNHTYGNGYNSNYKSILNAGSGGGCGGTIYYQGWGRSINNNGYGGTGAGNGARGYTATYSSNTKATSPSTYGSGGGGGAYWWAPINGMWSKGTLSATKGKAGVVYFDF